MTLVRVQIPVLPERRAVVADVVDAYLAQQTDTLKVSVHTLSGYSWGAAHNRMLRGMPPLTYDYVLTGNDDCLPRPGALQAAVDFCAEQDQSLPGVRFYEQGKPMDTSYDAQPHGWQSPWTRIFFARPHLFHKLGPMLDLSWYVDIDYCQRLYEHGWRILMCDNFCFDHLNPPRHWAENGEAERQHLVYREACVAAGRSPLA